MHDIEHVCPHLRFAHDVVSYILYTVSYQSSGGYSSEQELHLYQQYAMASYPEKHLRIHNPCEGLQ